MRVKELFKWHTLTLYKSLFIFYGIMGLLYAFINIMIALNFGEATISTSSSSLAYLFVIGIITFSETFKFGVGHGISRKTMLVTTLATSAALSVATMLLDMIFNLIASLLTQNNALDFVDIFSIYDSHTFSFAGENLITALALMLFVNFAVAISGYFIGALNHRMSKVVRLFVYIGVPVLLIGVLPATYALIPKAFQNMLKTCISNIASFAIASPYNLLLMVAIAIAVLFGASVLLVRRAPFKTI